MPNIAVVTDSNSGISQKQADALGVWVVPMPFSINDETFYEDISLSAEQFYEKMESGADIITSQPSPESVMKLWDELLISCLLYTSHRPGQYPDDAHASEYDHIRCGRRRSADEALCGGAGGKRCGPGD